MTSKFKKHTIFKLLAIMLYYANWNILLAHTPTLKRALTCYAYIRVQYIVCKYFIFSISCEFTKPIGV